ncbi:hypothetical protein PR048_013811 [Dryococelus australis]|uniref:Uncharacterized protein n=1 Tax=Dryococelus australis TaxID=614101 RepID=A0ABQ9HT82_9NEOP|nr:hypothetical protein PR048_013811 [Dryococelus australis]
MPTGFGLAFGSATLCCSPDSRNGSTDLRSKDAFLERRRNKEAIVNGLEIGVILNNSVIGFAGCGNDPNVVEGVLFEMLSILQQERSSLMEQSYLQKWPRRCSGQTARLPPRRTGFDSRRGRTWVDAAGSTGFLGDLPFPPSLHSGAAPYSPHVSLLGSQDIDANSSPDLSAPLHIYNIAHTTTGREATTDRSVLLCMLTISGWYLQSIIWLPLF